MKIVITADIHFGIPNKLDDTLWAINRIKEYAINNNIEYIFMLGDFFHDRANISIEVLNAVHNFFNEDGPTWVMFPGNHDLAYRYSWKINSIRPLNKYKNVYIIDDIKLLKINNVRFWIVPFIYYEQVYMKVLSDIESYYEDGDILLTHIGVNNAKLNECFLIKNWNVIDFKNSKFDRVFAGHFHCKQEVENKVIYPGSPIPYNFTEGLVDHGFIVYNLHSKHTEFIKILDFDVEGKPPDYITVPDTDINEFDVSNNNVRIYLSREYSDSERNQIRASLIDKGARAVFWMKPEETKIKIVDSAHSNSKDLESLFKEYITINKPKKLNVDRLLKVHGIIHAKASKKLSVIED